MRAGMELPPLMPVMERSLNKDSVSESERLVNLDNLNQLPKGKPPRHISGIRYCASSVMLQAAADEDLDVESLVIKERSDEKTGFSPVYRSGSCAERGPKQYMEDEHVCIDNLGEHFGESMDFSVAAGAFYGVFDGHGGTDAAVFVRNNLLRFVVENAYFPLCVDKAIQSAFVKADNAFAGDASLDISSGTTALAALVSGRKLTIANAGDCRAVLGRRGRAIELSKDHKPNCSSERLRIEKLGGMVYDGYLNGQLSVSRAIGDWHMKGGPKSTSNGPLTSEPELQQTDLTEDDEFLIMGCDGLWDVMSSQCAVTMVRKELMIHNDPGRCSRTLVREALTRNACDNLTVIVVCFSMDPPRPIEVPQIRVRRSISLEGLNLLKGALDGNS